MEYNQFVCYSVFLVGIIFFAGAIAILVAMIKYDPDIYGVFLGLVFFICGAIFFGVGLNLPYSKEIMYTDTVAVTGGGNLYYVELDGNTICVENIEKIPKTDNERYQLKTIKYYTILGKEDRTDYTLIVPVDDSLLQSV